MTLRFNRRVVLFTLLGATAVAAVVSAGKESSQGDAAVAMPKTQRAKPATESVAPTARSGDLGLVNLEELRAQKSFGRPAGNAFASKTFYVPPPPPPEPEPPPPSAPALPFTFMGKMQEAAGDPVFFLVRANRLYSVRLGDVIDGDYRVEAASSEELTLLYIPMNIKQTLKVADPS